MRVVESDEHLFLKELAKVFLYNQGCFLVGDEVKLNQLGLIRYMELDKHSVMDVLGVNLWFFPAEKGLFDQDELDDFVLENKGRYELGVNVLRGIEVKVSRQDFLNGFICSGCNYHYLLTPMRLVALHEIPASVGLIEYNKYKFSCEPNDNWEKDDGRPFKIKGLRVVKRPSFRRIPQFQIDNAIARIGIKSLQKSYRELLDKIEKVAGSGELVYYGK